MKKIGISLTVLMIIIVGFLSGCISEQEEDQSNGTQDEIKLEGKIAYVSDGNIHVINPDGTNEISLTEGKFPVWSPDGKKISYYIYGGYDGYYGEIEDGDEDGKYVINADGTGKTRIAEFTTGSIWLPDGERILLIKHTTEEPGIYIVNADGSNLVRIAEIEIEGTVFSIDEKKIIYENPEENTVYIMDIDGTNITTLIEDTNVYQLTRSPDGKKIAYVTMENTATIYEMDADGKNKITLATSGALAPVWSPDSKKIAYLRYKQTYIGSLCVVNPDGTGKNEIVEGGIDYDSRQNWSPDSKKIVFTMDDPSNIYIVNVDGSGLTKLIYGAFPHWSLS